MQIYLHSLRRSVSLRIYLTPILLIVFGIIIAEKPGAFFKPYVLDHGITLEGQVVGVHEGWIDSSNYYLVVAFTTRNGQLEKHDQGIDESVYLRLKSQLTHDRPFLPTHIVYLPEHPWVFVTDFDKKSMQIMWLPILLTVAVTLFIIPWYVKKRISRNPAKNGFTF